MKCNETVDETWTTTNMSSLDGLLLRGDGGLGQALFGSTMGKNGAYELLPYIVDLHQAEKLLAERATYSSTASILPSMRATPGMGVSAREQENPLRT